MFGNLRDALLRLLRDRAGNVAIVAALSLPVVLGAFGLGAEAASWMAAKRGAQNAADAAAIAAATNADTSYAQEAKAVAAQYGFQDGVNGVTVTATNTAPCPTGVGDASSTCYSVTVSQTTPVLLAQVVGFKGDTTMNGAPAKIIAANAVALQGSSDRSYCLLALGTTGTTAIQTNGAPKGDLSGCNVMSNTDATCNGHNLKADNGDANGTNDGCGVNQHSNVKKVPDPYAGLKDNIPADPCGGTYPQEPATNGNGNGNGNGKNSTGSLPATNTPSGNVAWSGTVSICGDMQMANDVTITQDTTLVIYNGALDTNGYTLQTAAGAHATIVFAGSNGGGYSHIPTGGGVLDITAPEKGSGSPWEGMAMYQSPDLNKGVDMSSAGNAPTWNITGVTYFPNANVTFSGAVNKSSNGKSCFAMVVNNILINGTADILAHGQCDEAGVTLPTGQVPGRGKLVQ
jgi:Flp pilus assembly protein TadG